MTAHHDQAGGIVAVIGAESSGKSTLCAALARRYGVPWIAEYAREYLDVRTPAGEGSPGYSRGDVARIARVQIARQRTLAQNYPRLAFVDTDLVVVHVWWQLKYGTVPAWLSEAAARQPVTYHLLLRPDLEWESDTLRESPEDLGVIFAAQQKLLRRLGARFGIVGGTGSRRIEAAHQLLVDRQMVDAEIVQPRG